MTKFLYDKISERDIDMLVFSAFVSDRQFSDLFLRKLSDPVPDYTVCSEEVSKTDADLGESDLTFIIETDKEKIGVLIEDKIDAVAQPEQPERYVKRGNLGVKNGDYDRFAVFILCPEKYRSGNDLAKRYANFVSYEECLAFFSAKQDPVSRVRASQFERALLIAKNPHNVTLNDIAVDSFKRYADYKDVHYPELNLVTKPGNNGYWPQFKVACGASSFTIYHKTNKHCVDLTIPGAVDRMDEMKAVCRFLNERRKNGENQISAAVTGNSASFRIMVPEISMTTPFAEWEEKLPAIFDAVSQLDEVAAFLGQLYQLA